MNHTPEPWKVYEHKRPYKSGDKEREHIERSIYTAYDHPQLRGPYPVVCASVGLGMDAGKPLHMVSLKEEDARRIVACVNACKGIGTEYLEHFGGTSFNDFKKVKEQRDRLEAALAEYTLTLQAIAQGKYAEGEESAMAQAALESAQKILKENNHV